MKNTRYINSVNLNKDTNFPYLVLDVINKQSYPRNLGFLVMHWHEDLQFIYVHSGKIKVKTLDEELIIEHGNGILINKNVIHMVTPSEYSHYNSFIFPDYFLKFYFGGPAENFVDKITSLKQLPIYHFKSEENQWTKVLTLLRNLSAVEKNKTEIYPYEVLTILSSLWLEILKNIKIPSEKIENTAGLRMKKFLKYINEHYSEDVSLENLSKSANVSKSECLRCFKLCLQTTPYKYLIEFRLSKAAALLESTDKSISYISEKVGFNQVSHFGKCFKEKTGLSPKEYRKKLF